MSYPNKWQEWLPAVPIPALLLIIAGLWVTDSPAVFESQFLLVLVNVIFSALSSLLLFFLISRSFIAQGAPELLLFGCGVLLWGASGTIGPIFLEGSGNVTISIHNILIGLSSLCHLSGVLLSLKPHRAIVNKWASMIFAYSCMLSAGWLTIELVVQGQVPLFFIQGSGGTLVRQILLSSTIATFTISAIILFTSQQPKASAFVRWYCMSLLLIASGLCGLLLQSHHGSALNWVARLAQLTGGAYMIVAAYVSSREHPGNQISLLVENDWQENQFLQKLHQQSLLGMILRYGLAITLALASLGVRLFLEPWIGPGLPPYTMFYPIIMIVALIAGFGPGVTATVTSCLMVMYWLLPPSGFYVASPAERLGLLLFTAMGISMSYIAELYRVNREKVAFSDRESAVHESKSRLALFAEATFEGIVESDAGRIVDCNEQLARMMGYPISEMRGKDIASLIAPVDRELVARVIAQQQEVVLEIFLLRSDGTRIIVEAHSRPTFSGSTRRHTAIRDISERKRMEEALKVSEEFNRNTLQALPAHIAVIDPFGFIIAVNDAWTEFARQNSAEDSSEVIPGVNYCDVCRRSAANDDVTAAEALAGIEGILAGSRVQFSLEYPCHSHLEERWFLMTVVPHGSGSGAVISHSDITKLKKSEQAIRHAKNEWERTFDSIPDLIAIMDNQQQIIRVNKTMANRLGLQPHQFIGKKCCAAIHGSALPQDFCPSPLLMSDTGGYEVEVNDSCLGGNLLVSITPIHDSRGEVYATVHVARDITQLKRTESALREHEEQLKLFVEHAPAALAMFDTEMRYLCASNRWRSDYGLADRNLAGISHYDVFPEISDEWKDAHLRGLSGEVLKADQERFERADGSVQWLRWELHPWHDSAGAIGGIVIFVEDISTRVQAEEKLHESEERLKFHIENSPLAVIEWDKNFVVTRWTGKAEQVFGWNAAETVGKSLASLNMIFEDDLPIVVKTVTQLTDGVTRQVVVSNRNYTKNGSIRTCTWYNSVLTDKEGCMSSVLSKVIDITELKQAEAGLISSRDELEKRVIERTNALSKTVEALLHETNERMNAVEALRQQEHMLHQQNRHAAMGEMIGNIAHQWRQPLNIIGLIIQRLGMFYDSPSCTKEFMATSVTKSMEIIEYMSRTIDDFRNFFSKDREKIEFNVNDAISKALSLVDASFNERHIQIERNEEEEQVTTFGFPNEFAQVMLNILLNAKDAMIEQNIANPRITISAYSENGASVVTIADNAGGIPEDIIEKIFDPYFTTKGPHQGTGVGLFMSKAIIESHIGGRLCVRNNDEGAEFRIEVECTIP
jgi:PAS domain S-box-containing protein